MIKDELLQDIKALGGFPVYTVAVIVAFFYDRVLSAQLLFGIVLAFGLTVLIRIFSFKERPDRQPFNGFLTKIDASSFPSLHSMRASVLATLLILKIANPILVVLLIVYAIAVGYSRVMAKRHYVSDVVAGLVLGVFVALASVWLVARFIS
jgi:membrane-associated phospholipid phosphatase